MAKEANNKNQNKDNKRFMKDFKAEIKRVIWPTPKQLFNNTVAVISIVLIIATIVFVLDFTFEKINSYGIEKIKTMVVSENTESDSDEEDTEESEEIEAEVVSEEESEDISEDAENE